jgi:hypothetical protein
MNPTRAAASLEVSNLRVAAEDTPIAFRPLLGRFVPPNLLKIAAAVRSVIPGGMS